MFTAKSFNKTFKSETNLSHFFYGLFSGNGIVLFETMLKYVRITGGDFLQELKAEGLTKTYGEKILLNNISFLIHEKDRIGLIGTNGTGKSTLLKILTGQDTSENKGSIQTSPDYKIAMLSQETIFPEDKDVLSAILAGDSPKIKLLKEYEKLLLDLEESPEDTQLQEKLLKLQEEMNAKDVWQLEAKVKGILTQLNIPLNKQKIKELSGGQKKRVALAQVLVEDFDLLLLDEPTNHLDIEAITWLENYLKNYQGSLLMVTHDRYFLDRVTNRIFELDQGNLLEIKGNYESYLLQKDALNESLSVKAQKDKQLYKQELSWMRAGVQARGTKQQARINRFNELEKTLKENQGQKEELSMDLATTRLGKKVLQLKEANYQIENKIILKDFNLLVQASDRLGIVGDNGVGKTTLLNILAGKLPLTSGIYDIGETVKLAFYTQELESIPEDKRMISYLQEIAEEVENKEGQKISVPEMLERFLFPRFMHGTLIAKLSGGEKRRLYLLKLLMSQPNVLFLDEPTNDLDIATLTVLEDYLKEFPGSVIAVSHDRYFLDKTVTKLLILKGQGNYEYYYGTISDYLLKEKEEKAPEKTSPVKKVLAEKPKEKVKLTYMEKKEWETIEEEIEKLENISQEIKEKMKTMGSDFLALEELQKDLETNEAHLEEKMNRWEYLSQFV